MNRHIKLVLNEEEFKKLEKAKEKYEKTIKEKVSWERFMAHLF